jgi:hypothetical protein
VHFVENLDELSAYLLYQEKRIIENSAPRPGLILLNINLPMFSWYETMNAIQDLTVEQSIKVAIMVSSRVEAEFLASFGFDVIGFIYKPVTMAQLVVLTNPLENFRLDYEHKSESDQVDQ